jgi:predicted  nucleic acid-binding Zn-ribbon protein
MVEYKLHNGTLYTYSAGHYCGVLVTEKVMRKLVALQQKHLEDIFEEVRTTNSDMRDVAEMQIDRLEDYVKGLEQNVDDLRNELYNLKGEYSDLKQEFENKHNQVGA